LLLWRYRSDYKIFASCLRADNLFDILRKPFYQASLLLFFERVGVDAFYYRTIDFCVVRQTLLCTLLACKSKLLLEL
jgi:hypothetical protein